MSISICIGGPKTGKSTTLLFLSKILAKNNKKVLLIDTTKNQGIYSFFNYNFEIESECPLNTGNVVVRDDFDIVFTKPSINSKFDFKKLNKFNFNEYDYVFIEGDEFIDKDLISKADNVCLFQDTDKHTLLFNKLTLKNLNIDANKLIVIFNNLLATKFDTDIFLNEIISVVNNSVDGLNAIYELPFTDTDLLLTMENKFDGKLKLKKYSDIWKESLFDIVEHFDKSINSKLFKKFIRK